MLYQALPVSSLAPVSASSTVLRSRSPILLIMKKKMKPPTIRPALSSHLAQKWTRLDRRLEEVTYLKSYNFQSMGRTAKAVTRAMVSRTYMSAARTCRWKCELRMEPKGAKNTTIGTHTFR